MPTVTQHTVGTFSWPECYTPDPAGTKSFYSSLFGWTWNEFPMGDMGTYYIAQLRGSDVAAMCSLTPEMSANGVPPNWGSYVTVENADDSAKKAEVLGGKILMQPFDVMDHGRMAVIMDPIGATFSLWQAKQSIGAHMLNEPGSLGWTQLNASDPAKAKPFYTALFGWTAKDDPMPGDGSTYTSFMKSDGPAGGMLAMPPGAQGMPSHWLVYWTVTDMAAAHAKAESLGAKTFVPPTDVPGMVTFAVMQDPQGVIFALVKFL